MLKSVKTSFVRSNFLPAASYRKQRVRWNIFAFDNSLVFSINLLITCYSERKKEAGVLSLRCLLYANVLSNTLFTQWVSHRFWYSSRGGLIPLTHDQSVAANYRRVLTLRELQRTIRGNNRGKLIGANGIAKRGTREERKGVKARLQSLHSLEFVQSIGRYIYRSRDYYV